MDSLLDVQFYKLRGERLPVHVESGDRDRESKAPGTSTPRVHKPNSSMLLEAGPMGVPTNHC